ncbi:hypothetical protein [Spirosoma panaciterrae]|uniref:hypothetical protein n=1 Tax=Spirosoma panaciterrae TaxID=496058 RepID=UPI00037A72E7|nr:hypothetical protein [Spirosoma panaciterrae]
MKHLINFGLLIVAIGLAIPFFPLGFVVAVGHACWQVDFFKVVEALSTFSLSLAYVIDVMGNVICGPLLNLILKKNGGYAFGQFPDTISRCLGKNKQLGTLTKTGLALAALLNFIQPNHVELAAADY